MELDSASIRTFNDLGEAFVKQYKYNVFMTPDREQLKSMSQKDKETFKEYAQRWRNWLPRSLLLWRKKNDKDLLENPEFILI